MTARNTPLAPSRRYQRPCNGAPPPRASSVTARVIAVAAVMVAAARLRRSAWTGVRAIATSSAHASATAGTSAARIPIASVTKASQQLGVARAELTVDAVRECRRDGHDEGEVEQRAELDHVRQPARDRDGKQR